MNRVSAALRRMRHSELGPLNFGHVGWAFSVPGSATWEFGATESAAYNWRAAGNETAVLQTFRGRNGYGITPGYYTQYKCESTPNSSVTAASNEVNTLYGQQYDVLNDNCLTRSVAIFKTYDSSLGYLYAGNDTGPNWYFDNALLHFGQDFHL